MTAIKTRIERLEVQHAPVPEKAHIAFLPQNIDSDAYQAIQADIETRRAAGQHVVVFSVKNARIDSARPQISA